MFKMKSNKTKKPNTIQSNRRRERDSQAWRSPSPVTTSSFRLSCCCSHQSTDGWTMNDDEGRTRGRERDRVISFHFNHDVFVWDVHGPALASLRRHPGMSTLTSVVTADSLQGCKMFLQEWTWREGGRCGRDGIAKENHRLGLGDLDLNKITIIFSENLISILIFWSKEK